MKPSEIELLKDWLLVKPVATKTEVRAKGIGLELPDAVKGKERADKAIVLNTGEEVKKIKNGDKVAFLRYGPIIVEFGDEEFLFVRERDVLAVFENVKETHENIHHRQRNGEPPVEAGPVPEVAGKKRS